MYIKLILGYIFNDLTSSLKRGRDNCSLITSPKSNSVLVVNSPKYNGVLDNYIYFPMVFENEIFPIEVKAGKTGTLKSLQVYLAEKNKKTGIRLNLDLPTVGNKLSVKINIKNKMQNLDYKLISLPLYFADNIKKLALLSNK